ncbi:hypothetical protein SAMN05421881_10281, partial [Nitrosomonas halophila]
MAPDYINQEATQIRFNLWLVSRICGRHPVQVARQVHDIMRFLRHERFEI